MEVSRSTSHGAIDGDDKLGSKKSPEGNLSRTTSEHDIDIGTVGPIDPNDGHTEYGQYHRSITPRQIHMISLGGQIGAGLFISTGKNLRDGGPAGIFLAFAVVCSCVFAVLQTVSEMTIAFPVSGNFIEYADRFVDPALAFAAGMSMWLGWTAIVAAEATFFATIVNYWAQNSINDVVWCRSNFKSLNVDELCGIPWAAWERALELTKGRGG